MGDRANWLIISWNYRKQLNKTHNEWKPKLMMFADNANFSSTNRMLTMDFAHDTN